jgi:hypothetical protein
MAYYHWNNDDEDDWMSGSFTGYYHDNESSEAGPPPSRRIRRDAITLLSLHMEVTSPIGLTSTTLVHPCTRRELPRVVIHHILSFIEYRYDLNPPKPAPLAPPKDDHLTENDIDEPYFDRLTPQFHIINRGWYHAIRHAPLSLTINGSHGLYPTDFHSAPVQFVLSWFRAVVRLTLVGLNNDVEKWLQNAQHLPITHLTIPMPYPQLSSIMLLMPRVMHLFLTLFAPRHSMESPEDHHSDDVPSCVDVVQILKTRNGATLNGSSFGICSSCIRHDVHYYRCDADDDCHWQTLRLCYQCSRSLLQPCIGQHHRLRGTTSLRVPIENQSRSELDHSLMRYHWHPTDVTKRCTIPLLCQDCPRPDPAPISTSVALTAHLPTPPTATSITISKSLPTTSALNPYCGECMKCSDANCGKSFCDEHLCKPYLLLDILYYISTHSGGLYDGHADV